MPNLRRQIALAASCVVAAVIAGSISGANEAADASGATTFTGPAYASAACTPTASGHDLGIGPQQWNASVGLPLTPSGTPLAQRLVIGELNETANPVAVNNLLRQCGLSEVTLLTESWPGAPLTPGGESTLDATVIAAALPPNTTITMAVSPANQSFYGMLVTAASACGFTFSGDPTRVFSTITKSSSYPAGGCIISLSYNAAEFDSVQLQNADFMMDQLEAQGVIVVVAAGDEGSGGCISSAGNSYGSAVGKSVTGVALTSNVATLTSAANGFTAGQQVFITGVTEPFQGLFTITSVTTNTFSFGLTNADIPATTLTSPGAASVNFGGLTPQFLATHPGVVAVGGTQWLSQTTTMSTGLAVAYTAGSTYSNYVWKDNIPNPNCANLATFPTTGGEGTGGGQSALYTMPSYQATAATSSYPGATNFRMTPDVAALAGWPTYAISNYGMSVSAKQTQNTTATVVTSQNSGLIVGETVVVAGVGAPFDGTFTITGTPHTNAFTYTTNAITITTAALTSNIATITTSTPHGLAVGQFVDVVGATNSVFDGTFVVASVPSTTTFTYAKTTGDVVSAASTGRIDMRADWTVTGTVTQSCVASGTPAVCVAAQFPWSPVVGTSAATPLIAVGLANVNAVLSARGMAPIDNAGGTMDVHNIFYDTANSSAMTDVTIGDNDIMSLGGWSALPGFDMTTGMGVPNFNTLVNLLIARNTSSSSPSSSGSTTPTPSATPSATSTPTAVPITPVTIAAPILRPTNLGGGVQTVGELTVKPRRVVLDSPAGSTGSSAPDLINRVDRWITPVLPGLPSNYKATSYIRINGSWMKLGTTTSNRSGNLALPAIRMNKPGTYPIRIDPTKGKTVYLNLVAKKG